MVELEKENMEGLVTKQKKTDKKSKRAYALDIMVPKKRITLSSTF